jgi:ssDNA-binding Zn-finger/Zn-ribbon topoisomerase 1
MMDERTFYTEKPEMKGTTYICPKCRQSAEFQVRWLRRTKKKEIPAGAGEIDRAKFAKARDYLVRADDFVVCPNPRCRKRFEIPNDQTVVFV